MRVNMDMDDFEFYLMHEIGVIPTKERIPLLGYWKKYQYRLATMDEVRQWREKYPGCNIAIVTGKVSRLVCIDVDNMNNLSDLLKEIPELKTTTSHNSYEGMHFLFKTDKSLRTRKNYLGIKGVELKAEGATAVAPYSVVEGIKYRFETSLAHLRPFPERLLDEEQARIAFRVPEIKGDRDCLRQALEHPLEEGERNNVLWFLYHGLQIEGKNSESYARWIVEQKNKSLGHPLPKHELEGIFRSKERFYPGCQFARDNISFTRCEGCQYLIRRKKMRDKRIGRFQDELDRLPPVSHKILNTIDFRFEGKRPPSISKLHEAVGGNYNTVKKRYEELDEKGLLPE